MTRNKNILSKLFEIELYNMYKERLKHLKILALRKSTEVAFNKEIIRVSKIIKRLTKEVSATIARRGL